MKLMLFLGAGVSFPSGMPLVTDLTEKIFRDDFHQDGYNLFKPGLHPDPALRATDTTPRIRRFLELLREHDLRDQKRPGYTPADKRSTGAIFRGPTNYEDLYFLCGEIKYWGIGLVDNSMVTPLMETLADQAGPLLAADDPMGRLSEIGTLGEQSCSFIESVVTEALQPRPPVGFDLVYDLAANPAIEELHIMTLNHDTLVEQFLTAKGVDFVDGFGPPDGDVRWHDDGVYTASPAKVKIYKLHGSISWYSILRNGRATPAILLGTDRENIRDGQGNPLKTLFSRPSFLTGINKAVAYKNGIYADMQFRFEQILRETEWIVMSGYGWGDAAITLRLDSWIGQSRRNTIIFLHPNPEEIEKSSLIVASGYDAWINSKQLISVPYWLCDASINELSQHLQFGVET